MTVGATQLEDWGTTGPTGTTGTTGTTVFWPLLTEFDAVLTHFDGVFWRSFTEFDAVGRQKLGTHRRLGHVPPLSDVFAVLLVRHADPLFGHHLLLF